MFSVYFILLVLFSTRYADINQQVTSVHKVERDTDRQENNREQKITPFSLSIDELNALQDSGFLMLSFLTVL